MAAGAADLVDHVIPEVPVRQWVLSIPKPVRYVVAYDTKLATQVLGVFMSKVFHRYRAAAKRELGLSSVKKAHPAAVVVVQRFASAAQLNWHLHALVADGIFTEESDKTTRFHALPAPEKGDLLAVAWSTCQRTLALLRKLGRWVDAEAGELPDTDREENLLLAQVHAAAIAGVLLFDNQRRPMRLFGAPAREAEAKNGYGFDVDAAVRVPAGERARLENLCQYVLRPPIANDRLRALPDNHAAFEEALG